jgi:ferric-dicitrate binding protein FerR (iron transport regulator)
MQARWLRIVVRVATLNATGILLPHVRRSLMPGTMPSIDRDALARLQAGDQQALRRIFDDHYSTLTQEAATVLEDPRGAPKVVENVFVRVWDERGDFDSPESLETFLHQATRQAAARAQSRKASLHRFESHERVHVPHGDGHARKDPETAQEAWAHVEHTIYAREHRGEMAQELVQHARHATAEHVGGMTKRKIGLWSAVGLAVVALIVLTPIFFVDRASEDRTVRNALRSREARTLVANQGSRTALTLGDGTDVLLGGDSRLTVPPGFGTRLRGVGLQGTGTFTVAPGEMVFQVRAKDVVVKATGTKFAVRAYADEDFVAVRVKEGQVSVQGADDPRMLTAGQAILVDKDGALREPTQQELDETLAWVDGRLVMTQKPMPDALSQLQRWYNLGLVVRDSSIMDRAVTMNVSLDSSSKAIAALEQSANVKFAYEGRVRTLRDAAKK